MPDIPTMIGELARDAAQLALIAAPSSTMPAMASENWLNSMLDRKLQQRQAKEVESEQKQLDHRKLLGRLDSFWDDLNADLEQNANAYNAHPLIAERIEQDQTYRAVPQRLPGRFRLDKSRFPNGRLVLDLDRDNERIVYSRRHKVKKGSATEQIKEETEFKLVLERDEIHLEENGEPVENPTERFLSKFLSIISVDPGTQK